MNEAQKSEPVVRLNPSLKTNTLSVEGIACKPSYPESSDFSASGW